MWLVFWLSGVAVLEFDMSTVDTHTCKEVLPLARQVVADELFQKRNKFWRRVKNRDMLPLDDMTVTCEPRSQDK